MKFAPLILISLLIPSMSLAEELHIPKEKSKCPSLSFEGEKGWHLKKTRKDGNSWELLSADNQHIARFDCHLTNTDQKQLPEVETKDIKLGLFDVEKYTVTTTFPEAGTKATDGLITSYNYNEGRLSGLVVMTDEYSSSSGLDKKLETALATIK